MLSSTGVRTGSSRVKSWSKLFTSLLVFWKTKNKREGLRRNPGKSSVSVDFGLWACDDNKKPVITLIMRIFPVQFLFCQELLRKYNSKSSHLNRTKQDTLTSSPANRIIVSQLHSFLWCVCVCVCELTMRGLNGGLIFLCSSSVQSISLKNGWSLMASSRP